jgi:hypothetical protein
MVVVAAGGPRSAGLKQSGEASGTVIEKPGHGPPGNLRLSAPPGAVRRHLADPAAFSADQRESNVKAVMASITGRRHLNRPR